MKTLVINLPQSSDRLASLLERLKPYPCLETEIIEAIDGRKLSQHQLDHLFNRETFRHHHRRYPRPGEIGCTLSHQKAYSCIEAHGCNSIILEDDVYPTGDIASDISDIDQWLSEGIPRIVMLGCACLYRKPRQYTSLSIFTKRLITPHRYLFGSYAYALNPEAATRMRNDRPSITADEFIPSCRKSGIELKAVLPPLFMPATEDQAPSTVGPSGGDAPCYSFADRLYFFMRSHTDRFLVRSGLLHRLDSIDFRPT